MEKSKQKWPNGFAIKYLPLHSLEGDLCAMYKVYICQWDVLHSITKLFPVALKQSKQAQGENMHLWGLVSPGLRTRGNEARVQALLNCPPPPPCFPKLHFHWRPHPHCLHSLPALVWLSLHHLFGGSLLLVSSKDRIVKSSQIHLMFLKEV